MMAPELRLFRNGGREFRANRSEDNHVVLSEWAAEPGEEWHKVSEFALSYGELSRLTLWVSEEEEPDTAPVIYSSAGTGGQDRPDAEPRPSELDEAVARGEAQRVDPIPADSDDLVPPPKARGAFKRPSV
jgi:hypothetical protein